MGLGDPQRRGSWDRRGLVVGLVQSGKTSHYIGLVNNTSTPGGSDIRGNVLSNRSIGAVRLENGSIVNATIAVIKTGRNRRSPPSMSESWSDLPRARNSLT